ncbi:putative 2-phosphosulfolactate phosphatase [Symmachiella dynata]|uniref:Probable 2-phosphosulfolactate phosphatase n=1 Tax=Symmachiella dynata TaxID=2527995 RepID=A0A517ZXE3_9PLAN|nr:2-phosphosulfolactate phosphatase [Symmachiella dynata]QDU47130.1 putative 2-phosphosulfolactate phosphatase [Symmachiella dynata]
MDTPTANTALPFSVHLLPQMLDQDLLTGSVAVVIDLLRASTTITTALDVGAEAVVPCATVDAARQLATQLADKEILLGGERQGTMIAGFDLDNSPAKYTAERIAGKTIIFTTTNGTAAIDAVAAAERIVIGCFANLNALLDVLIRDGRPVRFICAGTNGEVTVEDALCAGAIATALWTQHSRPEIKDDQTTLAMSLWESAGKDAETFLSTLRNSYGGRNLRQLGLDSDIVIASHWDTHPIVPELSTTNHTLYPATNTHKNAPVFLPPPNPIPPSPSGRGAGGEGFRKTNSLP